MLRALTSNVAAVLLTATFTLLATGALSGCMNITEQLDRDIAQGNNERAIDRGMAHLQRSGGAQASSSENRTVRKLVAAAAFEQARASDTVAAYQSFEQLVGEWEEAAPLLKEAARLKAEAAFRNARKEDTLSAYRTFRTAYRNSRLAGQAHELEANLEYDRAAKEDTLDGWRAFLSEHADARIGSSQMRHARTRETELSLEALKKAPTVEGISAFRAAQPKFRDSGELKQLEQLLLFEQAKNENTLEALIRFRERFQDVPAAKDLVAATRSLEATAVKALITPALEMDRCVQFVNTYSQWPEAKDWLHILYKHCLRLELNDLIAGGDGEKLRTFIDTYRANLIYLNIMTDAYDALQKLPPGPGQLQIEQWMQASYLLTSIFIKFSEFLPEPNDSSAQEKKRKKRLQRALAKLKKKLRGDRVEFLALRILDVEPEKALTSLGKKKVKRALRALKRSSPLARGLLGLGDGQEPNILAAFAVAPTLLACTRCIRETGKYTVTYELPVPAGMTGVLFYTGGEYIEAEYIEDEYIEDEFSGQGPRRHPDYLAAGGFCFAPEETGWSHEFGLGLVPPRGRQPTRYLDGEPLGLMDVKITQVIRSEKKALALMKGSVVSVKGKIRDFRWTSDTIHLELR